MKIQSVIIYCLIELMLVSSSINSTNEQNTFENMIEKEKTLIEQLKLNLAKNSHILNNLDQQINLKSEVLFNLYRIKFVEYILVFSLIKKNPIKRNIYTIKIWY